MVGGWSKGKMKVVSGYGELYLMEDKILLSSVACFVYSVGTDQAFGFHQSHG